MGADDYPQVEITSRAEWRRWLGRHHDSERGVWVITHKKSSGGPYVPYDDIVEEAIAHGWVDSRGRGLDEERSQLLVTPRRQKSGWSRPNKQRVERLVAAGLMRPAGEAAIAVAKENGSWSALDDVENLVEPSELREALDAEPAARRHWDAFPRSAKRATLEWISTAKRPETKAKRVAEAARLARDDRRFNQ